ncbi:MAG TPA: hypothetical protein VGJ30_13060 [Candidatus Angelobacter sp.]
MPEERYAYYRRCQRLGRNSKQCKAPAMKGQEICYKHEAQAGAERRRAAMRARFKLPPLKDLKTVQQAIRDVAHELIADRIDEKTAGELLDRLQRASLRLRPPQSGRPLGRQQSSTLFAGSGMPTIVADILFSEEL